MNAQIITIGDELLIGQVVDTNSAWLGEHLTASGIKVDKIISIQDEENEIIRTIKKSTGEVDIVIVSGGLGPTKDDITKSSIAKFLGVEMLFNQDIYDKIIEYLHKHGRKAVDAIKQHALFPEGTIFLENIMGTAPGMVFYKNNCLIISVPGVPYELKYIMENEGFPLIRSKNKGLHIRSTTILTAGEFEARLSDRLNDIVEALPSHFSIAFLPNLNQVRLRLTARGENPDLLEKELADRVGEITSRLGKQVFGFGKETLAEVLGKKVLEKGLSISTAESCTGGYLSHLITSVSGSSAYYKGSVIAYSNEIKMKLLNVKPTTLSRHGAVSEETVIEMVKGVLASMNTDLGIAVSGIAGPDGGSPDKPVGTIWIACGDRSGIITKKVLLAKDREKNIQSSAIHALDLMRHFLMP